MFVVNNLKISTKMEDNLDSVSDLITKLCVKFAKNLNGSHHKNVKRLKRKCYEILLSKSGTEIEPPKGLF